MRVQSQQIFKFQNMEIYLVHAMHVIDEQIDNHFVLSAHETKEGASEQMKLMREADIRNQPETWREWKYWSEKITLMK